MNRRTPGTQGDRPLPGTGPAWVRLLFAGALFCAALNPACRGDAPSPRPPEVRTAPGQLKKLEIPRSGAYTGAYIDFGETEDDVTLEALEGFEKLVGKHQAIVAMSSYWGRQSFPLPALRIISAYGAVPLVYWSPWDYPFEEEKGKDKFNPRNILAGRWDAYIDLWAQQARSFGGPMLVSWGLEMNGDWFPWSGLYCGGSKVVPGSIPERHEGPENYKNAYRHVVDRVRAAGAHNIEWVFHANNSSNPNQPWNRIAGYFPGSGYVDWLALSAYGQQYPGTGWTPFEEVLPAPYREICAVDPDKPFLLAEWGVGEFPNSGSKGEWIREAFRRMPVEFPRLKAAVFWHERWQNGDLTYSNLRVHSSEESLAAYRQGVANPFWLDRPVFVPGEKGNP
jgi:hypothetical protein